ncbi:MAG: GtrA-like protein [Deltaproteobacteria bacterium]|nr:GtrA-like protein [Deltaproteobacteria bacterium]
MLTAGFGGAIATACDVSTLVLLVEHLHVSIPASAFVASTVGAVACFLMNKHVAFRDRRPVTLHQLVRFGLVAVATAFLMAFAMKLLAVDLHVPYLLAKIASAAVIFVAWTYPAQRRLVFARHRVPTSPAASLA